MKKNQTKRAVYFRVFGAFLATYLVLMAGFSLFLLDQEKKVACLAFRTSASQVNNTVEDVLQDDIDSNHRIVDLAKVKREFVRRPFFGSLGLEAAVFTGDYNLIYNTNDYWLCSYTERREGNRGYSGYGLLNPQDWFSPEEIAELENYINARPKAEKPGDLTGYSVTLEGFWLDNEMMIPDKITVNAMYARTFDEKGNVESGGGIHTDDIAYTSNYQNSKGLPYFEYGHVQPFPNGERNSPEQSKLRQTVLDQEKLKEAVKQLGVVSMERVRGLTYRYYLPLPYRNAVKMTDDQKSYTSEFWTVIGRDVNLGEQCGATLVFVGLGCLAVFMVVALILAKQTYKTYQKREELERKRRETTDALAHDLKTPLSIISGYAQNLLENVHTEKREHYAGSILSNVERMDGIIREMLELSRLEAHMLPAQVEDVSLGQVAAEIIHRYSQLCAEKSLTSSLAGDAVVKADQSLISRAIDNFFINALEHTPEGGTIRISIADNTFEIYNSGSRIPEDKIKEIWEPYQKADGSRGSGGGTGLGLAISRTILELYHFSYEAQNVEDGVVFRFKFA